jgi:hypothetical protein
MSWRGVHRPGGCLRPCDAYPTLRRAGRERDKTARYGTATPVRVGLAAPALG